MTDLIVSQSISRENSANLSHIIHLSSALSTAEVGHAVVAVS